MDDGMFPCGAVASKLLTKSIVYGCMSRGYCQQCSMSSPYQNIGHELTYAATRFQRIRPTPRDTISRSKSPYPILYIISDTQYRAGNSSSKPNKQSSKQQPSCTTSTKQQKTPTTHPGSRNECKNSTARSTPYYSFAKPRRHRRCRRHRSWGWIRPR